MKYISNLIYLIAVIVIAGSCSSNKYMSDSNSTVSPFPINPEFQPEALYMGFPLLFWMLGLKQRG